MCGVYFFFFFFLYCNLLQLTLVEGLLLPFLYIHTCVIFNKCIQTLKKTQSLFMHVPIDEKNELKSIAFHFHLSFM